MMSCCRRLTAGSAAPLDFHRGQKDSASTVAEVVSLPLRRIRNRHLLQPAISLRAVSRRRSELFLAEAAVGGHSRGVRERPDGGNEAAAEEEELPAEPLSYSAVGNPAVEEEDYRGDLTTPDVAPAEAGIASRFGEKNRAVEVAIAAAATVVLGVGNRLLYKLALVPLKHYPFFLAQLATVGYVLVYFTILHFRHRAGIVSNEMLSLPKGPFILVGILEALGAATGMAAAGRYHSNLEWKTLRLLFFSVNSLTSFLNQQTFLEHRFQLYLSERTKSSTEKTPLLVKFVLVSGNITALGGLDTNLNLLSRSVIKSLLAILTITCSADLPCVADFYVSCLPWKEIQNQSITRVFPCCYWCHYNCSQFSSCCSGSSAGHSLKEAGIFWSLLMILSFLFQAADTVLKGGSVDIFVVNSFGSAYQALFICLLVPFMSKLWGIPFSQLPSYLKDGAACFLNIGSLSSGCEGAPLLPLLFIIVNMGFNISLLHLLKISSAVVSSLASTFSVPISVFMFTLPLPYIGVASTLPKGFVGGAIILVLGLLIYAWTPKPRPAGHSSSPAAASSPS
ncbi:unnamed protein product [Linum tenue]|uniref:Uncharacterized protein n=1 Tax=Linum tenue TaxID=586396 RepID=A0AAV0Q842_9ROSI|nr:unnamed protein product [Linum tenue]